MRRSRLAGNAASDGAGQLEVRYEGGRLGLWWGAQHLSKRGVLSGSSNRADELVLVLLPPSASTVEALVAAYVVPHLLEVGVSGVDSASDELAAARDRASQNLEEALTVGSIKAVDVSDGSETRGPVLGFPSVTCCVDVVVDREAHPSKLGEVIDRSNRGGEIEVDEADCATVAENHVLETHVVVTDQ